MDVREVSRGKAPLGGGVVDGDVVKKDEVSFDGHMGDLLGGLRPHLSLLGSDDIQEIPSHQLPIAGRSLLPPSWALCHASIPVYRLVLQVQAVR
jgi:hypothetical protein